MYGGVLTVRTTLLNALYLLTITSTKTRSRTALKPTSMRWLTRPKRRVVMKIVRKQSSKYLQCVQWKTYKTLLLNGLRKHRRSTGVISLRVCPTARLCGSICIHILRTEQSLSTRIFSIKRHCHWASMITFVFMATFRIRKMRTTKPWFWWAI